jgi:Tfp pilus assembly protein PilF
MRPALLTLFCCGCLPRVAIHAEALRHNELCAQRRDEIHCRHAIEFSPQFADPWVNLGLIAQARGDKAAARDAYIKALRLNEEHAQAYNNLGTLELDERSFSAAARYFERALKVNPDFNEARHNLGLAHWRMGQLDQAEADFRHMIAANPDLAQPYGSLGALALERGRPADAVPWLEKAVLLEPTWVDAWHGLAAARDALGLSTEAAHARQAAADLAGVP